MNQPQTAVAQAETLFPSGPWSGYYLHHGSTDRHKMGLDLKFAAGLVDGSGDDDIGRFQVRGHYDPATLVVTWTKAYPGSHDVHYRGFREGRGIWGTWEVRSDRTGGFQIWPGGDAGEAAEQATTSAGRPEATKVKP